VTGSFVHEQSLAPRIVISEEQLRAGRAAAKWRHLKPRNYRDQFALPMRSGLSQNGLELVSSCFARYGPHTACVPCSMFASISRLSNISMLSSISMLCISMFVSIYDSAQVGHAILMAARTIVLSERPPRVFLVFVSLFVYEDNGDGIDGFGTLISGAGSDPVSIRLCRRRPASVLPHRIKAASRTEVYGADGRSEVMVDAAPWTSTTAPAART
jgi:hypothetical protein